MSYDTYAAKLDDQFRSFDYSPPLRRKGPSPMGTLEQRKKQTRQDQPPEA